MWTWPVGQSWRWEWSSLRHTTPLVPIVAQHKVKAIVRYGDSNTQQNTQKLLYKKEAYVYNVTSLDNGTVDIDEQFSFFIRFIKRHIFFSMTFLVELYWQRAACTFCRTCELFLKDNMDSFPHQRNLDVSTCSVNISFIISIQQELNYGSKHDGQRSDRFYLRRRKNPNI